MWEARIHGPMFFGAAGAKLWCSLVPPQPLLLEREPNNVADANAIIVRDLYGAPAGYIERKMAAVLAPKMDAGNLLMAKVIKQCRIVPGLHSHTYPPICRVWIEEQQQKKTTSTIKPTKISIHQPDGSWKDLEEIEGVFK